jgi:Domain of unknown function (DUF222)
VFDSPQSPVGLALSHLAAAREQLRDVDLPTLGRDELLELMTALEVDARRRAAVGFALVAELEARGIAAEVGCASTAVLLSERLRIGRREAAGRVRLAAELGGVPPTFRTADQIGSIPERRGIRVAEVSEVQPRVP